MDTNSNNKFSLKKLASTTWGTLLIIFIFAIISVCVYAPIKEYSFKDDPQEYFKRNDFIYTLTDLTRYLKEVKIENNESYSSSYENLKSIKYYIGTFDKKITASNVDASLITGTEKTNSQFYLHIKTDEYGNPHIQSSSGEGFNEKDFIQQLVNHQEILLQSPNLEIIYAIPKDLTGYNDFFTHSIQSYFLEKYLILILTIGVISILILIIVAFASKYDFQKEASLVKGFNSLFLEFKILSWIVFGFGCYAVLNLLDSGSNGSLNYVDIIYNANSYFYLIGIPITFVLYLLIYLSIGYIKYIYHTGFLKGFIQNSIFGKILFHMIRGVNKLAEQIIEIDLSKKYQLKFLMILGINLVVLCVIALAGPLGLVLALGYTIFLFKYLITLIDKIRSLNIYSGQLAKGNFDALFPEDMGILNPIVKNLNNIKVGFKVAIDKEVKSQHMKTELISNVSHDLKTPLTSIITYVDLLKCDDLDDESRKEYIDILDKKSKRLQVLIEDLFEASKASSGNIDLQLEQVDVIALLRQTLGELEEKINDSNLQMKINLPDGKVICELDGRRTYRVFENILSNILKYALENSRVYIDTLETDEEISFIFKNISAYEMNFDSSEIMERFTRGDKSRNTEGSGLGLSIAKSLVELQKGSLSVTIDGDLFKLTVTFPKA